MAAKSTRGKLLSLVDDIELIGKEMFESLIMPKSGQQKVNTSDHLQLTELLIQKDHELKATLKLATEQAEIQVKMDALQVEVDKQDQEIRQLQKHLKEAEHMLSTAIYQAKMKLQTISRANKQAISSEELIKYAHRISASNTVAAPLTWQQGDPRRPYPTDYEMRSGLLGRLSDHPLNNGQLLQQQQQPQQQQQQQQQQQPSSLSDALGGGSSSRHSEHLSMTGGGGGGSSGSGSTFSWQPSSDISQAMNAMANQNSVHMDVNKGGGHNKENEDVEVMSTDSSSSSSSDSQ